MNPRQTYPLGALFVLTAVCGVLASLLTFQYRAGGEPRIGSHETMLGVIGGAAVTCLLGMVVGLFQRRPFAGVLWGGLTGVIVGACTGPLVFLPREHLNALIGTVGVGSLMLVGAAALIRYWSRSNPRS